MIGADQALSLLSTAVGQKSDDVDVLDALLASTDQTFVRFGCSTVLHTTQVHHPKVIFRAIVGGQPAEAITSDFTPAGLNAARDRAISLARAIRPSGQSTRSL
jgi:hypothetical protein